MVKIHFVLSEGITADPRTYLNQVETYLSLLELPEPTPLQIKESKELCSKICWGQLIPRFGVANSWSLRRGRSPT